MRPVWRLPCKVDHPGGPGGPPFLAEAIMQLNVRHTLGLLILVSGWWQLLSDLPRP